ncbi:MAG: putative metal-dependent hydrolase [Fulvivirga sp.]|uniref:YfiT family bacillithiol transferase n=1 Tax=Fulvivirga sp. TaxID=1931237 RepID=UPI0032ED82D1
MDLEKLRYPIGKLNYTGSPTIDQRNRWIQDIAEFPDQLRAAVKDLTQEQLQWHYRPEGWTIRQLVHHCADSHINAQLRFKLALTEGLPTIKPYKESLWAQLPDIEVDISVSLDLLTALHKKWVYLLERLSEEDFSRQYIHPEHNKTFDLNFTVAMYSWHCRHHYAHVLQAIAHKGQFA